jgi:hypothetical protein
MSPHRIGTLLSRRERADLTCPLRHARKLTAVLWCLLQTGGRDGERAADQAGVGQGESQLWFAHAVGAQPIIDNLTKQNPRFSYG